MDTITRDFGHGITLIKEQGKDAIIKGHNTNMTIPLALLHKAALELAIIEGMRLDSNEILN